MFLLPPLQTLPPFSYRNMVLICYCPVQLLFKISLSWRRTLKRRDSHLAVWNRYDFCCCYLFACFRRQTVLFLLFWVRYSPIPQPRGSLGQHRWPHNQFFIHSSVFFTALWDLANSRPVHSLMLSFQLFFCLPCLLPPLTVLCKMVLGRPDERKKWPYHCSLRPFIMVTRFSSGPIACWILAVS